MIYGAAPLINNKAHGAFIHQMFPSETHQYRGLLWLLLHFAWTWIGVISQSDNNMERFIENVLPFFSQHGICLDFIEIIPKQTSSSHITEMVGEGFRTLNVLLGSTAKVILIYGEVQTMMTLRTMHRFAEFEGIPIKNRPKVWLMTAQIEFTSFPFQRSWNIDFLHGALSFALHSEDLFGFQEFLQSRNPFSEENNGFIREFWEQAFHCSFLSSKEDRVGRKICTGEEKLNALPQSVFELHMTGHSYSIFNGIYAVAHALNSRHSFQFKHRTTENGTGKRDLYAQPWQVISIVVQYLAFGDAFL